MLYVNQLICFVVSAALIATVALYLYDAATGLSLTFRIVRLKRRYLGLLLHFASTTLCQALRAYKITPNPLRGIQLTLKLEILCVLC